MQNENYSSQSSQMIRDDDEISHLLQHFRPKADFIVGETEKIQSRRRKRKNGGDDDVTVNIRYSKLESCLKISYLRILINNKKKHQAAASAAAASGMIIQLKFQVSTNKPYKVQCLHDLRHQYLTCK